MSRYYKRKRRKNFLAWSLIILLSVLVLILSLMALHDRGIIDGNWTLIQNWESFKTWLSGLVR